MNSVRANEKEVDRSAAAALIDGMIDTHLEFYVNLQSRVAKGHWYGVHVWLRSYVTAVLPTVV